MSVNFGFSSLTYDRCIFCVHLRGYPKYSIVCGLQNDLLTFALKYIRCVMITFLLLVSILHKYSPYIHAHIAIDRNDMEANKYKQTEYINANKIRMRQIYNNVNKNDIIFSSQRTDCSRSEPNEFHVTLSLLLEEKTLEKSSNWMNAKKILNMNTFQKRETENNGESLREIKRDGASKT